MLLQHFKRHNKTNLCMRGESSLMQFQIKFPNPCMQAILTLLQSCEEVKHRTMLNSEREIIVCGQL